MKTKSSTIRQYSIIAFLISFHFLPSAIIVVASKTKNNIALTFNDDNNRRIQLKDAIVNKNIVSLPLLPHETIINRRLQENSRLLKGTAENINNKQRPNTYANRRNNNNSSIRNLSLLPDHQQVSTLYQGYGTHYVDLWVGTPNPQRQTVIVDTGSQLIAFPCSECHDCGDSYHTDGYYNEDVSDSFDKLTCDECSLGNCANSQCHLGLSYQEGSSWSAFEAKDIIYAGGMHDEPESYVEDKSYSNGDDIHHASAFSTEIKFGCQTSLTGLFKTQLADGILGMSDEGGAFWRQMLNGGVISKQQFSLCFSRQTMVDRQGTLAGAITLGGRDERLSTKPLVYARNVKKGGFYTIHLKKVMLWKQQGRGISAAEQLKTQDVRTLDISENLLNSGGVIVDSGTTDTYFNHILGDAFKKIWKDMTGNAFNNNEVSLTEEELMALPTILFQMEGDADANKAIYDDPNTIPGLVGDLDISGDNKYDILVALPPSHYMEFDPDKQKYIPRFYVDEYGGSVLGANFMMGHDVLFDIDNKRLGFTESDCDYLSLLNPSYKKNDEHIDEEEKTHGVTNKTTEEEVEEELNNEKETTPFAHPTSKYSNEGDDDKLCDRQCESIIALSILFIMSFVTMVNKIVRWRRRYSTVDDFIPAVELSSQHGSDDDGDGTDHHEFTIGDDEDGFLDPKRRII